MHNQSYLVIAILLILHTATRAEEKGICNVQLLSDTHYNFICDADLKNTGVRKATVRKIGDLYYDLQMFSTSYKFIQVRKWLHMRSSIEVDSIEDLLASQMIGVLICDTIIYNIKLSILDKSNDIDMNCLGDIRYFLKDYDDILRKNLEITASNRAYILTVVGESGEASQVFSAVLRKSEEASYNKYIKKWGTGVESLRKAPGLHCGRQGLDSLADNSAKSWDQIIGDPKGFQAKAFFAGVDLYIEECSYVMTSILNRLGMNNEQKDKNDIYIWDGMHSPGANDFSTLFSRILTGDFPSKIRNKLLLTE